MLLIQLLVRKKAISVFCVVYFNIILILFFFWQQSIFDLIRYSYIRYIIVFEPCIIEHDSIKPFLRFTTSKITVYHGYLCLKVRSAFLKELILPT